jgi:hypothetical protein
MGCHIAVIWVSEKPKYFFAEDRTGQISLIALTKLDFWRTGFARRRGLAERTVSALSP